MPNYNYVKFQRGPESAYLNLAVKSQDTLYFVYDESNSKVGKLYLGDRLLTGLGEGSGVTSLRELEDVLITGVPSTGSFLVYNNANKKWENKSLEAVIDLIAAEKGLGFTIDENVLKFNPAAEGSVQELTIIGFAEAAEEAIGFKGTDGTLHWGTPTIISDISEQLESIKETVDGLDQVISDKISALNHLTYKTVADISEVVAPNIVYLVPNPDVESGNAYLEYMFINGNPELLGSFNDISLDGYATVEQLNTVVGDLNELEGIVGDITKLTTYNPENPQTIIDELNAINMRLTWENIPV